MNDMYKSRLSWALRCVTSICFMSTTMMTMTTTDTHDDDDEYAYQPWLMLLSNLTEYFFAVFILRHDAAV